jgi:hypothetical protein
MDVVQEKKQWKRFKTPKGEQAGAIIIQAAPKRQVELKYKDTDFGAGKNVNAYVGDASNRDQNMVLFPLTGISQGTGATSFQGDYFGVRKVKFRFFCECMASMSNTRWRFLLLQNKKPRSGLQSDQDAVLTLATDEIFQQASYWNFSWFKTDISDNWKILKDEFVDTSKLTLVNGGADQRFTYDFVYSFKGDAGKVRYSNGVGDLIMLVIPDIYDSTSTYYESFNFAGRTSFFEL